MGRRSRVGWGLLGSVLLWGTLGAAQTIQDPDGSGALTLATSQAATGASAAALNSRNKSFSLVVTYCVAGGTATVKTQITLDGGTKWVDVLNSTKSIDSAGTACDAVSIPDPQGAYATNVTARTGSVTTKAYLGARVP